MTNRLDLKIWSGQAAQDSVALKIDGVQAIRTSGCSVVSRSGVALHNINPEHLEIGKRYEVWFGPGKFEEVKSVVRTHNHERKVQREELFEVWPNTSPRLWLGKAMPAWAIRRLFGKVVAAGHEGLVIDQTYKLKNEETHDVPILGFIPGKGQHTGRIGAFLTPMGKVGIMKHKYRAYSFDPDEIGVFYPWQIGDVIEVECMEVTPAGKFRMPRFVRHRWDKALNQPRGLSAGEEPCSEGRQP